MFQKIYCRHLCVIFFLLFTAGLNFAQANRPITYFLEDIEYDASVPSPEDFLGFQIGDWHLDHALLVQYMERLAETSGRVVIQEYARSYEFRPLVQLIITSEQNHRRLESIRTRHLQLTDPELSADIDISDMPLVVRLGYGVHGNEPSAHNAAPLVAYYLSAGLDEKVSEILDNMIIIIDPSLNPDGQDRFASWVNRHRSHAVNPDPNSREFRDVWPGSRTNHYWFDLNRDWLAAQQPESRGRIAAYHQWMPNINTDHHEFGPNSTFFFQPGEPSRVNHRTPRRTDDLTLKVAGYHAAAFDKIGQRYYMQQGFDDFFYGKGSTYPDVQGSIGILFEQASSRGYSQETIHGILDFAQTIRNQVLVSLSTIEAGLDMRETLLEHLRWFFTSAIEEASGEDLIAYIFGDSYDDGRNYHLLDILHMHGVAFYEIEAKTSFRGQTYLPGRAWVVPLRQAQYRLIQSMFEKVLTFEDSLFYDVSAWNKPLLFNIPFDKVTSERQLRDIIGKQATDISLPAGGLVGEKSQVAYVFSWDAYYAPRALYFLQKHGLRAQVATEAFSIQTHGSIMDFDYGSIMIPVTTQDVDAPGLYELIKKAAGHAGIKIYAVETSRAEKGIHLGSGSFAMLNKPGVLMLIGQGTNSREAGEIWHLLDQRFHMPVTMVELDRFSSIDPERYNAIVMVSGSYNSLDEEDREKLKRWIHAGGTVVALGTANRWLDRHEFASIEFTDLPQTEEPDMLPYHSRRSHQGARRIPGSIFQARIDPSHPVAYGYKRDMLPVFVSGTLAARPLSNPFANPVMFTENSLLSGYVWEQYTGLKDHTASVLINNSGRGRIVSMIDNPNFRGYCFGTNRLFLNALFFGQIM